MGTRRRFCNCRLGRLQQPFEERLCFDEASRRRRRRRGRSRIDEACEEFRVLSIDSPTLHGRLERLNCGRFCALTFDLTGLPKASPVEGRVRLHFAVIKRISIWTSCSTTKSQSRHQPTINITGRMPSILFRVFAFLPVRSATLESLICWFTGRP